MREIDVEGILVDPHKKMTFTILYISKESLMFEMWQVKIMAEIIFSMIKERDIWNMISK